MSTATSIVGTWVGYVAWGCSGPPVSNAATVWTFNADGSWSYEFGGGRWIQVEGLAAWNFSGDTGEPQAAQYLVYTANVTRNALDGIMGYPVAGASPGTGCFYAVRREAGTAASAEAAAVPKTHDLTKRPHDLTKGSG
jgi:hypothetical protein